ncbi:MAG: phosphoenolpyruvate--protein phosphotransferase [Faecalibacterium sp.]|jgi:phosphotransferase system enzyme I (PtsI)|nr:phosphoenolpyruvate--protein phosphotransferase [Faecalibacterium sp.]
MKLLQGVSASGGIVAGKVHFFQAGAKEVKKAKSKQSAPQETARLQTALAAAVAQLEALQKSSGSQLGKDSEVFAVHAMLLQDADFTDRLEELISGEGWSAEYAVQQAGQEFSESFAVLSDPYMKERAADILDAAARVLSCLQGQSCAPTDGMIEPMILAADTLFPSQTVQMDKSKILAFLTRGGAYNSHASILARTLGIPAIVNLGNNLDSLKEEDFILADGDKGIVITEPDEAALSAYHQRQAAAEQERAALAKLVEKESLSKDGRRIQLFANISTPQEAAEAKSAGAEGVGLFRSEFLFMHAAHLPSEDEQYQAYRQALENMAPAPVIIRTIDFGADKQLSCLPQKQEENPALGCRAIRLCFARPELLMVQLRALLRASAFGKLQIMFPMVATLEELLRLRSMVKKAKQDLDAAQLAYDSSVKVGIMVETPAAALASRELAAHADFFSIGTNDLTQYTLACDRMNEAVSNIFDSRNISVLRLIALTVRNAHAQGIPVGICGESAADPSLLPQYLALGVDELSMSAKRILPLRKVLLDTDSHKVDLSALAL